MWRGRVFVYGAVHVSATYCCVAKRLSCHVLMVAAQLLHTVLPSVSAAMYWWQQLSFSILHCQASQLLYTTLPSVSAAMYWWQQVTCSILHCQVSQLPCTDGNSSAALYYVAKRISCHVLMATAQLLYTTLPSVSAAICTMHVQRHSTELRTGTVRTVCTLEEAYRAPIITSCYFGSNLLSVPLASASLTLEHSPSFIMTIYRHPGSRACLSHVL